MKKRIGFFAATFIFVAVMCSCTDIEDIEIADETSAITENTTITETTEKTVEPDSIVNVVAVGDNLIHSSIYNQAAKRAGLQGYDFDFAYERVENMISKADLAILNQETPIANDTIPPADYPCFNSPVALGDKMIDMGFNAVSHSNNHILDQGVNGLLATLDYWESRNILVYGAYRNEEDLESIPTKEINGITFSFVGFTEHTNMIPLSEESEAIVVYTSDTAEMKHLIEKAESVSDVVVVSVHWGDEGWNEVADRQKELAESFTQWGADFIIGTHPHTPQTMEYIESENGNRSFVAYSLGNFISAQNRANLLVGIVLDLDIVRNGETGNISIENVRARPVITHYGYSYSNITLYPYKEYNDDLASQHGVNSYDSFSMAIIDNLLNKYIPEEYLYLK